MSARRGWTVSASWFTPRLAFWPTDGEEYQSDLFDFFLSFSSSSPQLFSQLPDRPSSHSSMSTHVKDSFKERVRRLHFFPPYLTLLCFLSLIWSAANLLVQIQEMGNGRSVRCRRSPSDQSSFVVCVCCKTSPSSLTAPICESARDNGPIVTVQGPHSWKRDRPRQCWPFSGGVSSKAAAP